MYASTRKPNAKSGGLPGLQRRQNRLWMFPLWMEDQLDLLPGRVLEGGDGLPDRLVFLGI